MTTTRRQLLQSTAAAVLGGAGACWFDVLRTHAAETLAQQPRRPYKSCIVLWTGGGISQLESFDPKPDGNEDARGPFGTIPTSVPGVRFSELLPRLAQQMHRIAVVRSMQTSVGVPSHGDGTRTMHRTDWFGDAPMRVVRPNMGSTISAALAPTGFRIPTHVVFGSTSEGDPIVGSSGFLGRQHAAMVVGDPTQALEGVRSLQAPQSLSDRLHLFEAMEQGFAQSRALHANSEAHRVAYRRAVDFMNSTELTAFDLDRVPDPVRSRYGKNDWGNGCLLAARLVEIGVPFVKVANTQRFGHFDTHDNHARRIRPLYPAMDAGAAALIEDLHQRGLLETTLVIIMGEFGRTPTINRGQGRDHHGKGWSLVMAGAGIKAGFVLGHTDAAANEVTERPVSAREFTATVCRALNIDPNLEFGARTGVRLTAETPNPQRMAAGDGIRLMPRSAAAPIAELFS